MLIDILIPTYNRAVDTVKNLETLQFQIRKDNLWNQVRVIISDNCSPDTTEQDVAAFCTQKDSRFQVLYFRTTENIGLEPNAVNVLSKAESPYVLFLGDDDFLAEDYLSFCIEQLEKKNNLGCIVPGLLSFYADGTEKDGRPAAFKYKELEAGYSTVWEHSHLGHQMSGVVCKRAGLLEEYLAQDKYRNPYLFLYFVANRMLQYPSIYAPGFKTRINCFNLKDWGYNKVGLLDEVYKCYCALGKTIAPQKLRDLLLRFTVMHSYRLAFKEGKITRLYQQYKDLSADYGYLPGFRVGLAKLIAKDYLKAKLK